MPSWDADTYLKFADERTRPSLDLVAQIALEHPARIIDLGCGPGNSTAVLRARWPRAEITGLDNSPDMIAAAREKHPEGPWVLGSIADWTAEAPCDLVLSNAAMQWVPNHQTLFPHLLRQVAPGGALAVQMPVHLFSPVHQHILAIADDPTWRDRMSTAKNAIVVERPSFYYDLLQPLAARIDLWETEYHHVLDGPEAIVTWIRGTGLRPFLQALETDQQRQRFETLLLAGVSAAYPRRVDGRVLFPFRRLFIIAYRSNPVPHERSP
jgi:trans-aconitate 2-methyltransferase